MPIAVLTGDIVQSTALPHGRLDEIMDSLASTTALITNWTGTRRRFTRQRGDGWQLSVAKPAFALRAALFVQATLRAQGKDLESRISIGVGTAEFASGDDLNGASGTAFLASGRGLQTMTGPERILHSDAGPIAAATRLADHISQGWTPAQALVVHKALIPLKPPTQTEIGADLPISRQAVGQALAAAGFDAIHTALTLIEAE